MKVTLELPEDIAQGFAGQTPDLPRALLESLALEGYRSETLSEEQIRRLLGFETRIEVHEFLKRRGVHLHYSLEDLESDLANIRRPRD